MRSVFHLIVMKCGLMVLCERHKNTLFYASCNAIHAHAEFEPCSAHSAVFPQQTKQEREIPITLYRPFCQDPLARQTL